MDWGAFIVRLDANKLWKIFYRMSKDSFMELLSLVGSDLGKNEKQGACSTSAGVIIPELRLSITLQWLAGDSYQDIAIIHGVHCGSVYQVVRECVNSLDSLSELQLKFPIHDHSELQEIAATFNRKAGHTVLPTVVGALDGILIACQCPNRKKCKNPVAFWTRKAKYAWNVQAICDGDRDFLYMSVLCPASTHDYHAWRLANLSKALRGGMLPAPFHLIADRFWRKWGRTTDFHKPRLCVGVS